MQILPAGSGNVSPWAVREAWASPRNNPFQLDSFASEDPPELDHSELQAGDGWGVRECVWRWWCARSTPKTENEALLTKIDSWEGYFSYNVRTLAYASAWYPGTGPTVWATASLSSAQDCLLYVTKNIIFSNAKLGNNSNRKQSQNKNNFPLMTRYFLQRETEFSLVVKTFPMTCMDINCLRANYLFMIDSTKFFFFVIDHSFLDNTC